MRYSDVVQRFDAILPAGGRLEAAFAERVGTHSKALIEIGGTTVLERTLRSLNESDLVDRTVVIGPEEVRNHEGAQRATHRIAEGDSGPENIFRGLDLLTKGESRPERVIVITTDLPFLSSEIIKGFVNACPLDIGIAVPLIRQSSFQARFPEVPATFVSLRDDVWTTGCMYLLDVSAMLAARSHIERVFENRKSKLGMAKLLGFPFVFKWLTKQLTLADVEHKIQDVVGCTGKAILDSAPELAFDIDYPADYEYALQHALRNSGSKEPAIS